MISFFDANCVVGRGAAPLPGAILEPEEILAEMDRVGIERALATHALATATDILGGNDRISQIAARHRRFDPCYVIVPHHNGEMPEGDALVRYLEEGGARAARMCPAQHRYPAGETWCGRTYATLAEAGIPVLIESRTNQITWGEVDEVMTAHPTLTLVLLRVNWRTERTVFALLAKHPNLKIETELYLPHRGIADITQRFGARRLIFGSGMPVYSAGAAMALILYAEIADADKQRIASTNLGEILRKGGRR
ncbi:MAG: amidohydrolase family protein [Planctomycetota bacterium]